jgi:(p)ppGpp synthase/HD superfamily hydrolase
MSRENKLLEWVKRQHEGQLIRRSAEPYLNHLTAVAGLAAIIPFGYEIGLCHDLLEETRVTQLQLQNQLKSIGYDNQEALLISGCVSELTDVFTKDSFPDVDKKTRKKREAARLTQVSSAAQTVKYADLLYNTQWMLKYDLKHAKKYLQKKKSLALKMSNGNQVLHEHLIHTIEDALRMRIFDKP